MKLRLQNSQERTLLVILEPWASEVTLAPSESVWVVAERAVPVGAYFDVEFCGDDVVVTPEWEGAIANFCDIAGNKLD